MIRVKRILTVGVILVVAFIVVGLFLSKTYSYEAGIVIDAPPTTIHPFVVDLERWPDWMPFYADPGLELTPGATMKGVGAGQSWQNAGGEGHLEMTRADADTGVVYTISLVGGGITGTGAITYAGAGDTTDTSPKDQGPATRVTWTMQGSYGDLMRRWQGTLTSSRTRHRFEAGLRNLKELVEKGRAENPQGSPAGS